MIREKLHCADEKFLEDTFWIIFPAAAFDMSVSSLLSIVNVAYLIRIFIGALKFYT